MRGGQHGVETRHVPIIGRNTRQNLVGYVRISVPSTQRVQSERKRGEQKKQTQKKERSIVAKSEVNYKLIAARFHVQKKYRLAREIVRGEERRIR